ncbi:MAG: F0F1 ATP synthase subunit B [Alphaproteobacteria bacterium]|nr:F0F1 ATP synthase subunit B [Alphaproteobacteria bacterium]
MDDKMPGNEILDATQDAVLGAAESVANAIENTAQELGAHGHEAFYLEAEFWVGAAFVLVVLMLARPVGKAIMGLLRGRGEQIANRIHEAVTLKEDAQKMLAEYERKFRGAEKEAAEMLKRSEHEVDVLKRDTLLKLEADMKKREQDAKMHLALAESSASDEVAAKTAEITIRAVKEILAKEMDETLHKKLIDDAIKELEKAA